MAARCEAIHKSLHPFWNQRLLAALGHVPLWHTHCLRRLSSSCAQRRRDSPGSVTQETTSEVTSMQQWSSLCGLASLCTAIARPAGAVMEPFTFDPEKLPETIGTQRDPGEHQAGMAALQKGLQARQVARGLRAAAGGGRSARPA